LENYDIRKLKIQDYVEYKKNKKTAKQVEKKVSASSSEMHWM